MNLYLTGACAFIVVLVFVLLRKYDFYLEKKTISRKEILIMPTIALIPAWMMLSWHHTFKVWIVAAIMIALVFINSLSGLFNVLFRQHWLYVAPDDSLFDQIYLKFPWLQWVKISICIISIIYYFILIL